MSSSKGLVAKNLTAGYDKKTIIKDVNIAFPDGKITAIVGANACGKSTLLRHLSRLQKPIQGEALLNGKSVMEYRPKALARLLGILPQMPIAPEGIIVSDLVARGRNPHLGMFSRWSSSDDQAVLNALEVTHTLELSEQNVDELSGGQRQRVWIAMVLAQETDVLLLDEPTTFLDVKNQIEVLDLLIDLNMSRGTTIIMVLHDLNLAVRYADYLVALADGSVFAAGSPREVVTSTNIKRIFGVENRLMHGDNDDILQFIPTGRHKK